MTVTVKHTKRTKTKNARRKTQNATRCKSAKRKTQVKLKTVKTQIAKRMQNADAHLDTYAGPGLLHAKVLTHHFAKRAKRKTRRNAKRTKRATRNTKRETAKTPVSGQYSPKP